MLKVKRDDFLDLNEDDNGITLDKVNDLFKQISDSYEDNNEDEKDNEN